jgi:pimeloyl-ACP methyl ester carboxylesterase
MACVPPELAPGARVVRFASASHWVHWDEPDAVNAALLAFLRRVPM